MSSHLAWSKLMSRIEKIAQRHGYDALDHTSQRLLEWIALRLDSPKPLYVQEVIMKSGIASPATLHKGLTILQNQGLLSADADPMDSRKRQLTLTSKAKAMLAKMARDFTQP